MSGSLPEADLIRITGAIHHDDSATMAAMLPTNHTAEYSFLNYACMQNSMKCIRWLLEHSVAGTVHLGYGNRTPLMTAVLKDNLECARLLLRVGHVDPNQLSTVSMVFDEDYTLPISKAIEHDRRDITIELLRYGARLMSVDVLDTRSWWTELLAGRDRCRRIAVTLLGLKRFRRAPLLASNGMDEVRMIAQHVWAGALDSSWAQQVE